MNHNAPDPHHFPHNAASAWQDAELARTREGFSGLRTLVDRGFLDTVLLAVPDMQGRLKGKRYGASHFLDRVATGGAEMCAYVVATDVDMRPLDGYPLASWDTGYGDMSLRPDPGAVHPLPWMPRTALVYADAVAHDGQPVGVAPRQILRRQLDQLAALGVTAQVGLETEFVLYQGTYEDAETAGYHGLQPVATSNLDYALDQPPATDRFLRRLQKALAAAGRPIEAIKLEGAPGQVEVTFPHGDPLATADTHLLFKHATRTIGAQLSLSPTFMAAPATGTGSGCHIHLSLHRDEHPLFAETDGRMPDTARHAIGGLIEVLPHLAPLYAPTVNSYKRYVAGTFAPVNYSWGRDNRTCSVRAVGRGDNSRLEVRLPGADANPYLALAAVLAAARHGLDHKTTPPRPCIGNAFQQEPNKAKRVPGTLDEALIALSYSHLPDRLLTAEVTGHYAQAVRHEIAAHRGAITDVERRRGYATA